MSRQPIRVGQKWRSKDPRDDGRIATVIAIDLAVSLNEDGGYVTIQRLRKSEIRANNLRRMYELVEDAR